MRLRLPPVPGGPRLQIGVAVTSLTLLALWAFSRVFVPPASEACLHLYRDARTAADTARVDHVIPDSGAGRSAEARSCGSIRQSARWF